MNRETKEYLNIISKQSEERLKMYSMIAREFENSRKQTKILKDAIIDALLNTQSAEFVEDTLVKALSVIKTIH